MKNFNSFILRKIFGIILITCFFSVGNYYFDMYGVFLKKRNFIDFTPNERSLKNYHFINSNRTKLIFSDSRGGILNTKDNFNKWYNMSYSMGVPEEFLEDLHEFLKKGKKIEEVIVFIDEVSIFEIYQNHENHLIRKKMDLNGIDKFQYLFVLPSIDVFNEIIKSFRKKEIIDKSIIYDIYNTGSIIEKNFIYNFEPVECFEINETENYSEMEQFFNRKFLVLKKIQELCMQYEIKINFISHPFSNKNYLKNSRIKKYLGFLSYLTKKNFKVIKPFDCNVIKFNKGQWRNEGHYNYVIGKWIEQKYLN